MKTRMPTIHVIPMTTTRETEVFSQCLGVEQTWVTSSLQSTKKLASVGNFALVIGSHDILDSDRFGLVSLSLLVAIHDGDGHDEEADVDLRKEGREGGREGGGIGRLEKYAQ